MSFLGDMALVAVASGTASLVFTAVSWHYRLKIARELKACKEVPPSDDAVKAATSIASELCRRMHALGVPGLIKDGKYGMLSTFSICKNYPLINILRCIHFCGGELVLRWRSDKDIEENPGETEKVLTSFNPKWYADL